MKTIFVLLILLGGLSGAQAEMITGGDSSDDNVVIADEWLPKVGDEEPMFGRRLDQRDIAAINPNSTVEGVDWQGQLSVVKEIPYSYPQLSRRTLAAQVLSELEATDK